MFIDQFGVNVIDYQSITFEATDRSHSLPRVLIHFLATELSELRTVYFGQYNQETRH